MLSNPALATWAKAAGFGLHQGEDGFALADGGGEVRYTVERASDGFILLSSDRGDDPSMIMWAANMAYIEVMLVQSIGPDVRSETGLSRVVLPFRWEEIAPGYQAIVYDDGWSGLSRQGAELPLRIKDGELIHPAVRYSHLLEYRLDDLLRSFSSPSGEPALSQFIR